MLPTTKISKWFWFKLINVMFIAAALTWGVLTIRDTYQTNEKLVKVIATQRMLLDKQTDVITLQQVLIDQLVDELKQRNINQLALQQ